MSINPQLQNRSNQACELCLNPDSDLNAYTVPPRNESIENQVVLCSECLRQIASGDYTNTHHWRCLEGSIWSEVPSVQVLSYKIMSRLSSTEEWARDTIESVYLDESLVEWANAEDALEAGKVIHKDSFGVVLETGDSVILTQNLNVKGTSYIAPKGTMVRKIKLVPDNADQIEGKINGDTIVILTRFVRKSV